MKPTDLGPIAPKLPGAPSDKIIIQPRILIPGTALLIAEDNRERISPVNFDRLPFSAIGMIIVEFSGGLVEQGTGFLIDPGVVLTAAHVLYSPTHGPALRATFTAACSSIQNASQTVDAVRLRVSNHWSTSAPLSADYGAIFLRDRKRFAPCGKLLVRAVAKTFLARHAAAATDDFVVAGFPAEKPDVSLWIAKGTLGASSPGVFAHRISTTPGQSGAPLFVPYIQPGSGARIPLVIGVHSRPVPEAGRFENLARLVDNTLINDLNAWALDFFGPIAAATSAD